MPFANITNPDGSPSYQAMLEQGCLIGCAYWNRSDLVPQILSAIGGGNLLLFVFDNLSWPPSLIITISGNTVSIAFTGTVNVLQALGDFVGAYGTPYPGSTVQANGFFLNAWLGVRRTVLDALPANIGQLNVVFTGHSYGAAVAMLGALDFVRNGIASRTTFCGFALPKTLTFGFNGPLPPEWYFVANTLDAVPFLPPTDATSMIIRAAVPLTAGIPIDWWHYPVGWTLEANNSTKPQLPTYWDATPSPTQIGSTPTWHGSVKYAEQIIAGWQQNVGAGPGALLIPIFSAIIAEPDAQTQATNVNRPGNVNFPYQNAQVFFQGPNQPLTPANVAGVNIVGGSVAVVSNANAIFTTLSGGNPMADSKITFFYHDNLGGFSESWYLPGKIPAQILPTDIYGSNRNKQYLNYRMQVAGLQTTFDYCRVSQVNQPRQVNIFYPGDLTNQPPITGEATLPGTGGQFIASDEPAVCLIIRRITAANGFSLWYMRGCPDLISDNGGVYTPGNVPNFGANLQSFFNYLIGQNYSSKYVNNPGTPPVKASQTISQITINLADGTALITTQQPVFTLGMIGKRMQVRISGVNRPKNVNGPYTVVVKGTSTCVTLNQFLAAGFVPNNGTLSYNVYALFNAAAYQVEKVAERKSGRPFGLSRGRALTKNVR